MFSREQSKKKRSGVLCVFVDQVLLKRERRQAERDRRGPLLFFFSLRALSYKKEGRKEKHHLFIILYPPGIQYHNICKQNKRNFYTENIYILPTSFKR